MLLDEYVKMYDISDDDISYKYHHSYRVMNNMVVLARNIGLSSYDIQVAKCIGLLHDVGRFEQDKLYGNFIDNKMDHGDYGEYLLRSENMLHKFNILKIYYEIIYKSVRNHNKVNIESGLSDREKLFAKLIRDADKLDILYNWSKNNSADYIDQGYGLISKEVEDSFYNEVAVMKNNVKNKNDKIILILAFLFDISFKDSFRIIYERKYYEKIYSMIGNKEMFRPYFEYAYEYIKRRIS